MRKKANKSKAKKPHQQYIKDEECGEFNKMFYIVYLYIPKSTKLFR